MQREETYIELKDISFTYGGAPVLDTINFSVKKGDYLGIIGPNGGGKTTLLRIILGLLEPTNGTVEVFGQDIHQLKDRYRIGYVPQRALQVERNFPATVEEVVGSGRVACQNGICKRFTKTDQDMIKRAMEIAEVAKYRTTRIGNLSGGELQRVFIARALAGDPKVLILDEPTTGVDLPSERKFYAFLGDLNRKQDLTIIFVSHDVDAVYHEAKSVLCLNRNMVCHGLSSEIMKQDVIKKLYGGDANIIVHNN